uniref:OSJNBa0044K18.19 protein n=1 Tax=Oryza sativa subsp. japonica TaxID=39947 RepID=Q7XK26_ORYSJ|nr:OSJNBa0044K18.19 [Oryza sativa Japonica Group]
MAQPPLLMNRAQTPMTATEVDSSSQSIKI